VGYLGYYLAWVALSYAVHNGWVLIGLIALFMLRGLLPPPGALFGALGRVGRLREQVRLNRANITARRDLATLYLTLLRPRRALPLLEAGLSLSPGDPELLYLHGLALHRAGRHDEALARLLSAIEKDPRLRHGDPYVVAGDTLLALRRWDDAADAFERHLDFSSSDVATHTRLARAYLGKGEAAEARKWLTAGIRTWHALPGPLKRRQLGAYFGAQWVRIGELKDPVAMTVALVLVGGCVWGAYAAFPLVARLWRPNVDEQMFQRMLQSAARCGTQQTGEFAGRYEATPEVPDDPGRLDISRLSERQRRQWQKALAKQYVDFRIERDRIVSGQRMVQEFCLTKVLQRQPGELHAEAIARWHQVGSGEGGAAAAENDDAGHDDATPGALVDIRLKRGAETTRFSFAPLAQPLTQTLVTLRRQP
jgi:tetratricopeptide (TPR) repeat protein